MSIENISEEVLNKANSLSQDLDSQAKLQVKSFEDELDLELKAFEEDLSSRVREEILVEKRKILSAYDSLAKKEVLSTKSSILDEVLEESLVKLNSLDKKVKLAFFVSLIKKVLKEFKKVDLIFCEKEFVSSLKKEFPKVSFSEGEVQGLIFESSKENFVLDYSFKQILREVFEEKEEEVYSILY